MGKKDPSPNDQRSTAKNPNNQAFKAARDNRANQLNPDHPAYRSSRMGGRRSGPCREFNPTWHDPRHESPLRTKRRSKVPERRRSVTGLALLGVAVGGLLSTLGLAALLDQDDVPEE